MFSVPKMVVFTECVSAHNYSKKFIKIVFIKDEEDNASGVTSCGLPWFSKFRKDSCERT